jgi:TMEM175 potassium channel family protein
VIGLYWMGHHRMFRRMHAYDETLLRLNLLLLFLIAFLPYPSAISGRFPNDVDATVFYAATLSMIGLVVTALIWYAFRYRRLGEADDAAWRGILLRSLIVPAVFLPSIAVAFFSVEVARGMWWLAFLAGLLTRRSTSDRRIGTPNA